MSTRIGFYGGSFDPPHLGHVALVRAALASGEVDSVLVVPVFSHALHKRSALYSERLAMTKLAFGAEPRVEVSDVEQHLPRPSYTLNTLVYLRKRNPHAEFRLIVGTDILPELPHWHQSEEVTKLAPLLLFRRRGTSSLEGIDAELPEVSSSEVRTCLSNLPRDMERLRSLVPGPVLEHILSHSLYLT